MPDPVKSSLPIRQLLCLFLVLLVFRTTGIHAAEQIRLLTYYRDLPYSGEGKDSETRALASWLSKQSSGRYHFTAEQLPRLRLDDVMRTSCQHAVAAWVSPKFVDYAKNNGYIWSKAIIRDTDLIVSNRNKPVEYIDEKSLDGYVLGGIIGRQYPDFSAGLQSGRIIREDTGSVEQNMLKLKLGRVDATFVQGSALPYFRQKFGDMDSWLYIASKPRQFIERRMLSCRDNAEVMRYIDSIICKYHPLKLQKSDYLRQICKPGLRF